MEKSINYSSTHERIKEKRKKMRGRPWTSDPTTQLIELNKHIIQN